MSHALNPYLGRISLVLDTTLEPFWEGASGFGFFRAIENSERSGSRIDARVILVSLRHGGTCGLLRS